MEYTRKIRAHIFIFFKEKTISREEEEANTTLLMMTVIRFISTAEGRELTK